MEGGGFEAATRHRRGRRPGFEPPVDPGGGPSVHGLSLVARIMRGRELAAEAAGIPPLDSDQVLDLQRTAGNQLTTGALARWIDVLAGRRDGRALEPFAQPSCAAQRRPRALLDPALPRRPATAPARAIAPRSPRLEPRGRGPRPASAARSPEPAGGGRARP